MTNQKNLHSIALEQINATKNLTRFERVEVNLDFRLVLEILHEFLQHLLATLRGSLIREQVFLLGESLHIGALAILEGKDISRVFLRINLVRERFLCRQRDPSGL